MARVARKLAGGFLGAGAGWWAYDAQTGHKMRTMTHPFYHRAFLEGSVTRLRNLLLCADTPLRAVSGLAGCCGARRPDAGARRASARMRDCMVAGPIATSSRLRGLASL